MINLSLNELKLIARSRHIKIFGSMSKERLLSVRSESVLVESEKIFDNQKIKEIREEFNKQRNFLSRK